MRELEDLKVRLIDATIKLGVVLGERVPGTSEWHRIAGKIEGVDLVRSYIDEELRSIK